MREIKFRAFCKPFGIICRVSDLDFINSIVSVVIDEDRATQDCYSFDQSEIMQFTGLKDKNGREIYEGDILKTPAAALNGIYNYTCVCYDANIAAYVKKCDKKSKAYVRLETRVTEVEVIGNIYEHPHLLPKNQAKTLNSET